MEALIHVPNGQVGYKQVVDHVLKHGESRAPRGLQTLDAGMVTVVIENPRDVLPIGCGRGLRPVIGALEAVQLIGAFSDAELVVSLAPNFRRYQEQDGVFHGAYGRRINGQLPVAVKKLCEDHDTRQAIITLWDPWLDNLPHKLDYPCTIALRLHITNDRLCLDTLMRSNDVWLGTPYDWFQFTQLQLTVANSLGIEPGPYRHTAWSLHIYEPHILLADRLIDVQTPRLNQPTGLGWGHESLAGTIVRARRLRYMNADDVLLTESERWYVRLLNPQPREPGNVGPDVDGGGE